MKKILFGIFSLIVCLIIVNTTILKINIVICNNGIFVGKKDTSVNVITFKGIPFAEQPIGNLRWKVPILAKQSNKIKLAFNYDKIALQTNFNNFNKTEECLKLNIWTADVKRKNKPVMVFFHGGSYGWQGMSFPIYNGKYLANEYRDIIVVSVDYRLNLMGFADFSFIDNKKEFKETPYLGILDCMIALKWIKQNIKSFGGNPNNVTIFGESAGGGIVSSLMVVKEAQGLFKRVIAQSGTFNLTYPITKFKQIGQAEEFVKVVGAKNMEDLMALTDKQILTTIEQETDKTKVFKVANISFLSNFPLKGNTSVIPENPYEELEKGISKDVDLLIGTNADEVRYWISLMPSKTLKGKMEQYFTALKEKVKLIDNKIVKNYFDIIQTDEDIYSEQYKNIWNFTELASDIYFRLPSVKMAESHIKAKGTGKTYMYYFAKRSDKNDWMGASHAAELPYTFNNLVWKNYGNTDKDLAKHISNAWINFVRTGNPSTDFVQWTEYDLKDKNIMVINNDKTMKTFKNYKGRQLEILKQYKQIMDVLY